MLRDELKLSPEGYKLFDRAVDTTREKVGKFGSVRTRFYYPLKDGEVDHVDLREVIDSLIEEFKLRFPFGDKKSPYAVLVNNKAFEVFNMKIHRLSPNNYLIVVQKENGKIVFIIRDAANYPESNLKVEWDDAGLSGGKVEAISFHISKSMLDLE